MLAHKRIRERQAECRAAYGAGSITVAEYVDTMNRLSGELKAAEEKMYEAAGHLDQIDLLRFITGTIPTAFKKIHARFPHLTFDEVIAFEQTVREAGGSHMTHSGMFAPTKRSSYSDMSVNKYTFDTYVSWTCCHSISHDAWNQKYLPIAVVDQCATDGVYLGRAINLGSKIEYRPHESYEQISIPLPSIDLKNPDPCGHCDNPSLFSLTDETESQKTECTIAEIKSATQAQIDKIEAEISELRRKAGYFDDLLKTLDALSG